MATLVQKQAWLVEAEAARHALLTGQQHASITKEGVAATYSKQDIKDLEAYIQRLRVEIDPTLMKRKRFLMGF